MIEEAGEDRGFTLIEVLVSIVILGLTITAMMAGFAGVSQTAGVHRDQSDAHTYLVNAAERVKLAPYPTTSTTGVCTNSVYDSYFNTIVPTGWTLVASLAYWDWSGGAFSSAPGACTDNSSTTDPSLKLERVTLTVTSPNSRVVDSVSLTKRAP